MNAQDVVRQAREADLRLVRFLYCDNGGIIRGKATHATKLPTRIYEGIGQTLAMQAFTGVETLASVEGMGPVGEFRLIPDPNTFVILPYVPSTGSMMCDMIRTDGKPWEACPRTFLKRMIARLAEQAEVIDAILEALEAQGISIELFHTELGPAQHELSIHHADVLRAADNVCLVRETTRGVARSFD